jgi:hypothetical protein
LALVQGGSHFSPLRLAPGDEALFRLGSDWVGVEPEAVQGLLLGMTSDFLDSLAGPAARPTARQVVRPAARQVAPGASQRLLHRGVTAYVLDPAAAARWRGR